MPLTISPNRLRRALLTAGALAFACAGQPAWTHWAPSTAEQAAYRGLHAAAYQGDLAANLQLLENDRYAAVTIASLADDQETLRLLRALVAAGASLQLADRQGATPLQLARSRGYADMVQVLEAAGAR
jgi:hypothetical protein